MPLTKIAQAKARIRKSLLVELGLEFIAQTYACIPVLHPQDLRPLATPSCHVVVSNEEGNLGEGGRRIFRECTSRLGACRRWRRSNGPFIPRILLLSFPS